MKLQGIFKLMSHMFCDFKVFEMKLLHEHINGQKLDHFSFCSISLESVANYLNGKCWRISSLTSFNSPEMSFLQGLLILTLAELKYTYSKILLLLTLMRTPNRFSWRWFNYKVMTFSDIFFLKDIYCSFILGSQF